MVKAELLPLVTHPRIFVQPTPMADAMRYLDALMEGPAIHVPVLGEEWAVLDSARLHQVTFDRDFRRLLSRHP